MFYQTCRGTPGERHPRGLSISLLAALLGTLPLRGRPQRKVQPVVIGSKIQQAGIMLLQLAEHM